MRLAATFAERFAVTAARTAELADSISDLQFTSRYRVPFQFSRFVRQHFKTGTLLASSAGPTVTDLDGNRFYDLTGSYGTNLFGYDFYKECIRRGSERVQDLGPVLGAYHPVIAYNVRRLKRDLGPRRSVLPHVRYGGRDAGSAPCAIPHAAPSDRAFQRGVSRLVGRCAAGRGQPGSRTRYPDIEGNG